MVEFMDRGKDSSGQLVEYHAYVKLTENAAAICSLCSGPAAKHSIWDDDALEVIKDTEPTATEPTSLPSASAKGSGYGREVTPGINPLFKARAKWPTPRRQPSRPRDEPVAGDRSGDLNKPAKVVQFDPAAIQHTEEKSADKANAKAQTAALK